MLHSSLPSRRSFLKGLATATAGSIVFPSLLRAAQSNPPSKRLAIGIIGCGGKGFSDMEHAAGTNKNPFDTNDIVAICDVDENNLAKAAMKFPNARQFKDFRKMLDEVKELDGVTVATPDHAHFPAAMHAMALGKHVCVQKPLTNTLWEAHELLLTAQKKGVITQMGNQGHTYEGNRVLKEWLQAGVIGKVKEAHVWTNRPIWPQGKAVSWKEGVKPDKLDWELWLASTPDHAYSPDIHPFKWRGFIEWGAGALGDMGCHMMDPIVWGLGLPLPDRVEAQWENLTDIAWPSGATVAYTWKNVPGHGEFRLYWYEGKNANEKAMKPFVPGEIPATVALPNTGFILRGTEGVILNEGDQAKKMAIFPEQRSKDFLAKAPAKTLERSPADGSPQQEWTLAIKNGKAFDFMGRFEYSVPLTETVLLGALAMRSGTVIEWDAKAFAPKNNEAAAKYVKRAAYRTGWDYSSAKV